MLIETKLMINANNEEMETLPAEQTSDDTDNTTGEADQASQESLDTENDGETTIQVSRSEYEKLQREAAAAKRLREKSSKEDGSKESTVKGSFDQELIARTFLAAQAGITDKDVQNEALRLASKFGMNIAEAMDDPDISTRLKTLQKQKTTQNAIAKGTGGAATRTKDATYYLTYFKQHGDFPEGTPSSMIAKVTQDLAGGA